MSCAVLSAVMVLILRRRAEIAEDREIRMRITATFTCALSRPHRPRASRCEKLHRFNLNGGWATHSAAIYVADRGAAAIFASLLTFRQV
jgi:hypothetical protein